MYIRKFHIFFIVFYILLFTSCGGGGGSSPQTNIDSNPTPQSASFIDAPVYGIDYSCSGSSTTGTTNENGTFDYDNSCGTLTFTIGGVTLYSKDSALIPSDKRLYITDLVGVERTDTNNSKVLALSRFIQSLDDNNNPYDCIKINPDVKISLANSTINFLTNPSIADLNNTIVNLGRTLVSENDAKAHFTYTLNNDLSLEIEGPPPPAPILTITPTITNQNSVTVEVNGQPQTTIFVNGITTNTTIPVTSKIEITLPLSGADGEYDFNISLQDNAHQIGNAKLFTIYKDTIAPIFSSASDINVSENNILMVDINANDATVIPYQSLVYSLSGGIDKDQLEINSTTGVISYLASIDYENPTDHNKDNIYLVTVRVTDGVNIISQDLQIHITNIAETTPTLTSFTGSIVENIANNSTVGVITFTSGDSLITNFELNNSDGSTQNIFNITNGGTITINDNSTIDFDNGIKQYSLLAQAQNDKGVSNTIPVIVNVTNVNDIIPTIANFTGTLNENTTAGITVGNLVVTSGDSAISSILLTDLNSSSLSDTFIANTTGTITVKSGASLDYETKNIYYLKAVATNSSGASTDANVTISLNDLKNEMAPVITSFTGSIDENATALTSIGNIIISTSGDSNITSFSISGIGAENFEINSTGAMKVASGATFNYETTPNYSLSVYATNSAGNSDTVNLTIGVNNIPEVAPILNSFSGSVVENAINGTVIGTIGFTSGDSAISGFDLNNSDESTQSIFAISTAGVITVLDNSTIDYDAGVQSYNLKAIARNSFGNSNSVTVTITVSNVSDTIPTIANFTGTLNENTTAGITVGNLVVTSGDSAISSIILTDLNSSSLSDTFIANTTGTITVKSGASLDYETKNIYYLKAVATNSSGASTDANVTISLNDVQNEIIPIIKFFSGSIDENATTGTIIGTIDINSSGDSNITSFSLTGTESGNFDINTTGTITLKTGASINYEITTVYQLEAYATNSAGDSAKVNVLISINNISEIVPTLANTTLFVDENGTLGTSVGQVTITTIGDSNITSFSLTGTNASNFTISSTGMITVASGATLSYPNTFSLEAKAINQAGESNPITVTITVQETPTALPVLHSLVTNVKEGTLKDTIIGQISIDAGNTAIREIVFTSGLNTHDDAFTISSDGKIRVSGDVVLDFETRPQYQFNVQAINALGESNIVTITINIVYVENLYILSAVYDNNNTTLDENSVPIVDDDTLYLYFNKTVDTNTFGTDKSVDFNITNGTGAIGSGSTTTYSDTPYHLYTIKGNYATGSLAFTAGLTKISIANQALTDNNGSFPTNYIATTVEAFRYIVATGQTTSYDNNGTIDSAIKDDGYYHKGKSKSFIRDDTNNIVVDNTNGLIWEDTTNTTSTIGSWTSANNYCQGLIIGIYTNWRLPTIQEWLNIVDRTKYEPVIDTTYFQNNVNDKSYWSSTVDATDSTKVWRINIGYGSILTDSKVTDSRYVRCLHDK